MDRRHNMGELDLGDLRRFFAVIDQHRRTMLRPAFEAGFYACWVLDPDSSAGRRVRGLKLEARDHRESNTYLREFESLPEVADDVRRALKARREVEQKYRDEAHSLHVSWNDIRTNVNVVEQLKQLRFVMKLDPLLRATIVAHRRMLSGYEHGLSWAVLAGSDAEANAVVPGGQEMRISLNDEAFATAWRLTLLLMLEAMKRYERLHTSTV